MKQYIVLGAVLPIVLALLMQISLSEINHYRASAAARLLHTSSLRASLAGEPSTLEVDAIRTRVAAIYKIDKNRVVLEVDCEPIIDAETNTEEPPHSEGQTAVAYLYIFKLSVPLDKLIVAPRLFRLSEDDTRGYFRLRLEAVGAR